MYPNGFFEACEKIIWDDPDHDSTTNYDDLAKRFDLPMDKVQRYFKEIKEQDFAQMALYGYKDNMSDQAINHELKQIKKRIWKQMNTKHKEVINNANQNN